MLEPWPGDKFKLFSDQFTKNFILEKQIMKENILLFILVPSYLEHKLLLLTRYD